MLNLILKKQNQDDIYLAKALDRAFGLVTEIDTPKLQNQDDTYLAKAVGLVKERFVFLNDIELFGYLFQATEKYDATILSKINNIKENFNVDAFADFLLQQTNTDLIAIETSLKEFATNNTIKVGELSGPTIPELIQLFGSEETSKRVKNCFSQL